MQQEVTTRAGRWAEPADIGASPRSRVRAAALEEPAESRFEDSDHQRTHHRCPQCHTRVKRVLRTANDKRRWDADDWRRYRCRSDTCGWQGLLRVSSQRRVRSTVSSGPSALARVARTAAIMGLAAGATWLGLQALQFMMGL